MTRSPTRLLLPALLGLLAACAQEEPTGHFALVRTAQSELPALLHAEGGCHYLLTGGSLTLQTGRTFEITYDFQKVCAEQGIAESFDDRSRGTLQLSGDSIRFSASGREAGAGTLEGDTLRVAGPVHTLIYHRASEAEPAR